MFYDTSLDEEPDLEEFRRLYVLHKSDPEKAISGIVLLAERGSIQSMLLLAIEYLNTQRADLDKAKYWSTKAEERGALPASYLLGVACLRRGENYEAFVAFSRGASRGSLPAMYRLAIMYLEGEGTPQDINKCRTLLETAASRGHFFAKRTLAGLYIRGTFGTKLIMPGILMFFGGGVSVTVFCCARAITQGLDAVLYDERMII